MKLHNVIQGSPEWHALRSRIKHTASDLAVIRGNSKYKTRTDAVREAFTGIKPEVNEFMQKKFDDGHATEAKARIIIEAMIGEDLYPSTATTDDEFLLASSDGSTMLGGIGYEHKLWNADLAADIRASNEYGSCRLHPMYTDQMDQLIAVFGFDKIIFVTSDGTADNMEWMHYHGNPKSIASIRSDWEQFDQDVANYQHVEVCHPTIKLGEICQRLGFTVSAEFLTSLGIESTTEKNARLYPAAKFPTICRLISEHVMAVAFKKAA